MLAKMGCAIAFTLLSATSAMAGAHYESARSTCTTINCAGMTIRGIQQSNEPFVIQVFAREGECLRLDVSTQTEDTALVLISTTTGDFVGEDDTFELRPIFGVDPVPATGWYTVAIGYFDYDPRIARFTLEYGRYPAGNINCSQATATQAMAPVTLKPMGSASFKVKTPPSEPAEAVEAAGQ